MENGWGSFCLNQSFEVGAVVVETTDDGLGRVGEVVEVESARDGRVQFKPNKVHEIDQSLIPDLAVEGNKLVRRIQVAHTSTRVVIGFILNNGGSSGKIKFKLNTTGDHS